MSRYATKTRRKAITQRVPATPANGKPRAPRAPRPRKPKLELLECVVQMTVVFRRPDRSMQSGVMQLAVHGGLAGLREFVDGVPAMLENAVVPAQEAVSGPPTVAPAPEPS